jgi:hypothetical protein
MNMKKIFFTLLFVFAAMFVKAEAFTGLNSANQVVRYCGTSEVISVDKCDCCTVVKLVNEYRSLDSDTIVERVFNGAVFVGYLSVGDKIDFCMSEYDDAFIVKRVRLKGSDESLFLDDIKGKGVSSVLRVSDEGVILLANGLIIKRPKQQHQIGDIVAYRLNRGLMEAKEILQRER